MSRIEFDYFLLLLSSHSLQSSKKVQMFSCGHLVVERVKLWTNSHSGENLTHSSIDLISVKHHISVGFGDSCCEYVEGS